MLCYLLAERSVLRETMPSGCTQDLRQNTDRPKPVNYILFFFLLKFVIFWEILLQAPPYVCCGRIRVDEARDWLQNQTNKTLQHDF